MVVLIDVFLDDDGVGIIYYDDDDEGCKYDGAIYGDYNGSDTIHDGENQCRDYGNFDLFHSDGRDVDRSDDGVGFEDFDNRANGEGDCGGGCVGSDGDDDNKRQIVEWQTRKRMQPDVKK